MATRILKQFGRIFIYLFTYIFIYIFVSSSGIAQAAILYTGSANQVVYVGQTFVVEWYLDTQDQTINTLGLTVVYPNEKLEAIDVSAGNSALDLWVKVPVIDQSKGQIQLVGGISGGVKNSELSIFRATFKPLVEGPAKLSIAQDSQVLLADGSGGDTSLIFNEVNFVVNPAGSQPAQISSDTHPNQDTWYKERTVRILVTPKPGEQYSYSFSSNLEMIPDPNPDDISQAAEFKNVDDGIYYFKLNSKSGPSNWQEAGVYRVKIDSTPPRDFVPTIAKEEAVFDGQAFIAFNTTDNISGVSYYEVKSNFFSGWQKTQDGYFKLPGLVLGDTIEVKVVDVAGNERVSTVQVDKSVVNSVFYKLSFWGIIILLAIIAVFFARLYSRLLKKYKVNDN